MVDKNGKITYSIAQNNHKKENLNMSEQFYQLFNHL